MSELVQEWLCSQGFEKWIETFQREDLLDWSTLELLTEDDFVALGLSMGMRKRLLAALSIRENDAVVAEPYKHLATLPGCLAKPLQHCYRPDLSCGERAHWLMVAFYQYLRSIGLMLLSDYLCSDHRWPGCTVSIKRLAYPHVAEWRTLVNTLAKHYRKFGRSFLLPSVLEQFRRNSELRKTEFDGCLDVRGEIKTQRNAISILHTFRNHLAHSNLEFDSSFQSLFPKYVEIFHFLLRVIPELHQLELIRCSTGRTDNLLSSRCVIDKGVSKSISVDIANLPDHVQQVLRTSPAAVMLRDSALPLYPLFILDHHPDETPSPQPGDGDLLLYDGHTNAEVCYLGLGRRRFEESTHARVVELLESKDIGLQLDLHRVSWDKLKDEMRRLRDTTLEEHYGNKFEPGLYLDRPNPDGLFSTFLQGRETCFFLLGEAGMGKSNFACKAACEIGGASTGEASVCPVSEQTSSGTTGTKTDDIVILVPGAALQRFSEETDFVFQRLREWIGLDPSITNIDSLLSILADLRPRTNPRFVVIFDGINESDDFKKALHEVDNLVGKVACTGVDWVKFVVTMRLRAYRLLTDKSVSAYSRSTPLLRNRAFYFRTADASPLQREDYEVVIQFLEESDARALYRRYGTEFLGSGWDENWALLDDSLRVMFRNPLYIRFYFLAIERKPEQPLLQLPRQSDLFALYLDGLRREKPRLCRLLELSAERMLEGGRPYLVTEDARHLLDEWSTNSKLSDYRYALDPFEEVLAEGVMNKSLGWDKGIRLTFSFQLLLEYLLFSVQTRGNRDLDLEACLHIVKTARNRPSFPELMSSLSLLFEALLKRGDSASAARLLTDSPDELAPILLDGFFGAFASGPEQANSMSARDGLTKLVAALDDTFSGGGGRSRILLTLAEGLYRRGYYDLARIVLNRCGSDSGWRYGFLEGLCYLDQSDYQKAYNCLSNALEQAPADASPLVAFYLAQVFHDLGKYDQELAVLADGDRGALMNDELLGRIAHQRASAMSRIGRLPEAGDYYEQAVQLFTQLRSDRLTGDSVHELAFVACELGRNSQALDRCRHGEVLRRRVNDNRGIGYSFFLKSKILSNMGRFGEAREAAREGYRMMQYLDEQRGQILNSRELAIIVDTVGDAEAAEELLHGVYEAAYHIGYRRTMTYVSIYLAGNLARRGKSSDCLEWLETAGKLVEKLGDPKAYALLARSEGHHHRATRDFEQARKRYAEYGRISAEINYKRGTLYAELFTLEVLREQWHSVAAQELEKRLVHRSQNYNDAYFEQRLERLRSVR